MSPPKKKQRRSLPKITPRSPPLWPNLADWNVPPPAGYVALHVVFPDRTGRYRTRIFCLPRAILSSYTDFYHAVNERMCRPEELMPSHVFLFPPPMEVLRPYNVDNWSPEDFSVESDEVLVFFLGETPFGSEKLDYTMEYGFETLLLMMKNSLYSLPPRMDRVSTTPSSSPGAAEGSTSTTSIQGGVPDMSGESTRDDATPHQLADSSLDPSSSENLELQKRLAARRRASLVKAQALRRLKRASLSSEGEPLVPTNPEV